MRRLVIAGLLSSLALAGCAASGSDQQAASVDTAPDREVATGVPSPEPDEGAGPEPDGTVTEPDDDATADPGRTLPEPDATDQRTPERPVEALAFTARALAGGTVDLAVYSGDAVALWMWAPW